MAITRKLGWPASTTIRRETKARFGKEYNRALSRIRVKVENTIRRLEIFRILGERYRDKRRGYGIEFNIIAGIVNLKMGYRAKIL